MARKPIGQDANGADLGVSGFDRMLLEATQRGDESLETGRYIVTYREDAQDQSGEHLKSLGLRVADARDYSEQAVSAEDVGDADALYFPEIGAAVLTSGASEERGLAQMSVEEADSAVEAIEPEYFAFADDQVDYLRGFKRAIDAISADIEELPRDDFGEDGVDAEVLGATWGMNACRVPLSTRTGAGIRVAILDTGFALSHPDFTGRPVVSATFVGQPVEDLHGHGTHCTGTACGPRAPVGTTPRYGAAWQSNIFIGKVLSNTGSGATAGVLAGMNWAIANRCVVISMSLGAQTPPQTAYTAAGRAALANNCLIVAAAGNAASSTGAPANSPTIMSVASLDSNLAPSSFSNFGKVEIAAPGRDVFSAYPMPRRYHTMSGTSMATPHVAGCAALWAQTDPSLRGVALWNKLLATARSLPHPATRVGRGLVQAPAFRFPPIFDPRRPPFFRP